MQRLYDSRFGDGDVGDIRRYIKLGPLGRALAADERVVLLIDEVDKADIEFPNDLLHELDRMRFFVDETGDEVVAKQRPVVIITSNNEKELPDAFLRRCVFHFIDFPEPELMKRIVAVHHPDVDDRVVEQAIEVFYELRAMQRLRKRPEHERAHRLDLRAAEGRASTTSKLDGNLPFLGTLLKKEQDVALAAPAAGGARVARERPMFVPFLYELRRRAAGRHARRGSRSLERSRSGCTTARSTASTTCRARLRQGHRAPRRLRRGVPGALQGRRGRRRSRSRTSCSSGSPTRARSTS